MDPISLSVMEKPMEMIYFTQVTLLQHQQVQNIPQLRNLSTNYLFGWSFLRGVFRRQSYEKVDLQPTRLSIYSLLLQSVESFRLLKGIIQTGTISSGPTWRALIMPIQWSTT
ncbi:hypothetical protein BpHYR1_041885 [Brachionus plicatilis]|uniref:Uncharacterized protein n=1 Tax=Brachionus plicatilis TaxID=10195 RepID=A0A3M7S159_BRAPC|nr:hypothetical protein BpHYR1_041885 [Brachionus plicatilis]